MRNYYYDIVASFCTENGSTGKDVVCRGFKTLKDALSHIKSNRISKIDYYNCIKIEKRIVETAWLVDIITIK